MKSSPAVMSMIKTYWKEIDQKAVEDRVYGIIDPALNKCLKIKLAQGQWDMLVTMVYGYRQSYTINEKDELIRRLNSGEKMIPENMPIGWTKKGDEWEQNFLK